MKFVCNKCNKLVSEKEIIMITNCGMYGDSSLIPHCKECYKKWIGEQ